MLNGIQAWEIHPILCRHFQFAFEELNFAITMMRKGVLGSCRAIEPDFRISMQIPPDSNLHSLISDFPEA